MQALRRPRTLLLLAVGLVLGGVVAALVAGGEDGTPPPELNGRLVEVRQFEDCLREAPKPAVGWRITGDFVLGDGAPNGVSAGGVQFEWGGVRGIRGSNGRLLVLSSAEGAAEFASRFDERLSGDDTPGFVTERWGNVLYRHYDGQYRDEPSDEMVDLIRGCAERAATLEAGPSAEFRTCKDPAKRGVFARQRVTGVAVAGLGCEEALKLVARSVEGPTGTCSDIGAGYACFTEFYCCAVPTEYATDGPNEIIWDGGF